MTWPTASRRRLPSILRIVDWLPTFVTVTGIAGIVTGSIDFGVGIALIVVGGVGVRRRGQGVPGGRAVGPAIGW